MIPELPDLEAGEGFRIDDREDVVIQLDDELGAKGFRWYLFDPEGQTGRGRLEDTGRLRAAEPDPEPWSGWKRL